MQFNGVNKERRRSVVVSGALICACTSTPCAPRLRCAGSLHSHYVYSECCSAWENVFKRLPLPPLPLSTIHSV